MSRLVRRKWLDNFLLSIGSRVDAALLPATERNGQIGGWADWIDSRDVKHIKPKRCSLCGRISTFDHQECKNKAMQARMAAYQELWDRESRVVQIRLQQRVVKLVSRLSGQLDTWFEIRDALKMLPYKSHINAAFRICMAGKVESKKEAGKWLISGRGILSLIKRWIDTGRAPLRTKASTRGMAHITNERQREWFA